MKIKKSLTDDEVTSIAKNLILESKADIKNSLKLKGPDVKVTNQGYGYDEPATRDELVSRIETCFEIIARKDKLIRLLLFLNLIMGVGFTAFIYYLTKTLTSNT